MKISTIRLFLFLGVFFSLGTLSSKADYYLRVSKNNGSIVEQYPFVQADESTYTLENLSLPKDATFRIYEIKEGNNSVIWGNIDNSSNTFRVPDLFTLKSNGYEYTNTVPLRNVTLTMTMDSDGNPATLRGTSEGIYLFGQFQGVNDWNSLDKAVVLTPSIDNPDYWVGGFYTGESTAYFQFITNGRQYGANSSSLQVFPRQDFFRSTSGVVTNSHSTKTTGYYFIKYKYAKITPSDNSNYTFTVSSYPDKLYAYGHLNNLGHSPQNYVEMLPVAGEDGVFKAEKVKVSGVWNQSEADADPSKVAGADTGNENIVAFFDHPVYDMREQGYRFGASAENNVSISLSKDANTKSDKFTFTCEETKYNYIVDEGVYDIEVSIPAGTVTFTKLLENKVEYTWHLGGNADLNAEQGAETIHRNEQGDYEYKLPYGQYNNIIQVGINNDPAHEAACQSSYSVYILRPEKNGSNGAGVKRYADSNDVPEDLAKQGYEKAIASTDQTTGDYTVMGSTDADTNHLIRLHTLGTYVIQASLDNSELQNTYDVKPSSLTVTLEAADIKIAVAESLEEAFGFTPGSSAVGSTTTLEGVISFDQEISTDDFTLTLKPTSTDWLTESDANSYESLLSTSLFKQYEKLGGSSAVVDGLYNGEKEIAASLSNPTLNSTSEMYDYDLILPVPCSGTYTLTITPAAGYNVTSDSSNLDNIPVSVYPNLYGSFGTGTAGDGKDSPEPDNGFNINGYTFTKNAADSNYTIVIPSESDKEGYPLYNAANCVGYIPGTYFASSLNVEIDVAGSGDIESDILRSVKKHADSDPNGVFWTPINLSALETQNTEKLNVTVAKNGASHKFDFIVTKGDTVVGSTTGVDAVGVEDGEAVYYNLQGVRVLNPQRGIFVKVANGKATKIVL